MPSYANELMLQELVHVLKSRSYIFFARYQGLPAADFVELRRRLERVAERTIVVKNSITRLAFKQIGIQEVNGLIKGSILLTLAGKDPHLVSKVLVEFAKGRERFELDGAYLEGHLVPLDYVKALAELPSREVLIASVVRGLNAPVSGFVRGLGQLVGSLAVCLDQIQKSKAK